MGQHAALLRLSPGMGPVHSRLQASSHKTVAFQHVLYYSVWDGSACNDSFYRKHSQARGLEVSISERWSIKVVKIMLYNNRNQCKANSSSCRLVQTPKVSSMRWAVGVMLVSSSHSGASSLTRCIFWSTQLLSRAYSCQQPHSWYPRQLVQRSRGSL